jgi:hypothetical protein
VICDVSKKTCEEEEEEEEEASKPTSKGTMDNNSNKKEKGNNNTNAVSLIVDGAAAAAAALCVSITKSRSIQHVWCHHRFLFFLVCVCVCVVQQNQTACLTMINYMDDKPNMYVPPWAHDGNAMPRGIISQSSFSSERVSTMDMDWMRFIIVFRSNGQISLVWNIC